MLKMIGLMVLVAATPAMADTYRPTRGALERHAHRCASPDAVHRVLDFVALHPKITIGHGQMTVTTEMEFDAAHRLRVREAPLISSADKIADRVGHIGIWKLPGKTGGDVTVVIDVKQIGRCTEPHTCATSVPSIRIALSERYGEATCYEAWSGDAERL